MKHDAALVEIDLNNPILKEIKSKFPVSIFTGIFVLPDVNLVAFQVANLDAVSFAEARVRLPSPGLHFISVGKFNALCFSRSVLG